MHATPDAVPLLLSQEAILDVRVLQFDLGGGVEKVVVGTPSLAGADEPEVARLLAPAVVVPSSGESRIMDITVPKSLEALVRRKVDEGHYSTEDEVVVDALRLMQARDEVTQLGRARLQDRIDRGYQDVAAGKVSRLESDDQIDAFFADL